MTLHGLLGHTTSLGVSVREDLRHFYDSCDNDAKRMYHQTIELLLEKGDFQRTLIFILLRTQNLFLARISRMGFSEKKTFNGNRNHKYFFQP